MITKFKKLFNQANYLATPVYEHLPLWIFPQRPLRFKAYCVGMAKTGTTSLHTIFRHQYRSAHEAESRFLCKKTLAFLKGKIDKDQFTQYIKHRDQRLNLEIDSSALNYFVLDILVKEFSEAKFILTLRDCYSWLDSAINYYPQAQKSSYTYWLRSHCRAFFNFVNEMDKRNLANYAKEEQILADNNFFPLDIYFSRWAKHTNKVLTTVPAERLLVVKTSEINQSIPQIEMFLGIEPNTLPTHIHSNKARQKIGFVSQIDKNFLEAKAKLHCHELMSKYFPEVKGYNFTNVENKVISK
jgi:hypothetical protein